MPAALLGIGVGLALVAWRVVYPAPETGIPVPAFPSLLISTSAPVYQVDYSVVQIPRAVAQLNISVREQFGLPGPGAGASATAATVQVALPPGITFRNCHLPYCVNFASGLRASTSYQPLSFRFGTAAATFLVNAPRFGVNYDGVNAYAAIPEVQLTSGGLTLPTLLAAYSVPSAGSYDWSAFGPAKIRKDTAFWLEALAKGDTPGRAAAGINHGREASDQDRTFFAGVLAGFAGGAILSAIQGTLEVLIRRTRESS